MISITAVRSSAFRKMNFGQAIEVGPIVFGVEKDSGTRKQLK
jgi:hypothetical protein